ncbi:hypothetical protein [Olleya sp. HaHaR_3_96]|uniref:hypothetical protein n=1 Tax=Olleya sp. HaHaR_3_96 TaxID=2745560 RepID=UPI001C4ED402|nr:hypothetical protein [Olleya sp. HaHaR_3_96]QXP59339.1 hypothetical protein H0I26_15645 [Olleya sp. HaHaR_3_96]
MKTIIISAFIFLILLTGCTKNESASVKTAKLACACAASNQESEGVRKCIKDVIKENKQELELFYKDTNIPVIDNNGEINAFYIQLVMMAMLETECPELTLGK